MNWEYKIVNTTCFSARQSSEEETLLNKHGAQGWCLVAIDRGMAYFRRPVIPTAFPEETF